MRLWLCVGLVMAVLMTCTPPPSTLAGTPRQLRVKRQISEIVKLYNNLVQENRNEREQAATRIRELVGKVFKSPNDTDPTTTNTLAREESNSTSTDEDVSTPKPPPKLDRDMLVSNLRRNLRGIGRLFMKELRDALWQSGSNVKTYGGEIWNSFLPSISG